MNIRVVTATIEEIEHAHRGPMPSAFRGFEIVPGAWPPEIVLTSALERFRAGELWFWCVPRLFLLTSENRIVGSGCFKNSPDSGAVEIGCGVADLYCGRGFATCGVELLVTEGFTKPEVNAITAETAVWNMASQRVMEKASFIRSGTRVDADDGPLICWRRKRISG